MKRILAIGGRVPRLRFLRQMLFDGGEGPLPPVARPNPGAWSNATIMGSCLGHSTVLMNLLGVRVLTDPVFSTRVGIGTGPLILGPRRRVQPALDAEDFANPDIIVLSHAHFDHLDLPSLRKFARDTPIVTATATGDLLRRLRFREVHELAWGSIDHARAARRNDSDHRARSRPLGCTNDEGRPSRL